MYRVQGAEPDRGQEVGQGGAADQARRQRGVECARATAPGAGRRLVGMYMCVCVCVCVCVYIYMYMYICI